MTHPGIVYEGAVRSSGSSGNLFAGKKFWFSRSIPQVKRFEELVQNNGGKVVLIEKEADIKLADHTRKDAAPNTYSYKYVEKSVQNGRLENLETHRVGPPDGTVRPVGAAHIPARNYRIPFSIKDDQILYDWLKPYEKTQGPVSGNKIFQDLEAKYPHHTYQSWKNRYKKIRKAPRPATPPSAATTSATATATTTTAREPTEPRTTCSERPTEDRPSSSNATTCRQSGPIFTVDEKASLLKNAENIISSSPGQLRQTWSKFAEGSNKTREEWQEYFEREVRPEYLARQTRGTSGGRIDTSPQSPAAEQPSPVRAPGKRKSSASSNKTREYASMSSPRTQQRSPSFQPESPSIRKPKPAIAEGLQRTEDKAKVLKTASNGRFSKINPQEKRKRDDTSAAASSHTPPETKRLRSSTKRRQTARAIAVEIPVMRQDPTRSRTSLPPFSHGPSAQLLGSSDFIQSADVDSGPKSSPIKGPPSRVSSSHSNQTHQTDKFEDAPQFQEKETTPRQDTTVSLDIEKETTTRQDTGVSLEFEIPPPADPSDDYMDDFMKELPFPAPLIPSNPDEASDANGNNSSKASTVQPLDEKEQTLQTEKWITSRLESGKATDEKQLIQALRCCSMEPHLADKVLKSLRAGKGIPGNMRGVWTEEDDESLRAPSSRDIERLLEKHGDDLYRKREDYFRLLNEVEKGWDG